MTSDNVDSPEDITGVGIARQVLGVDRNPPKEDIISAFEKRGEDATGAEYWTLIKAREICLISGMKGTAIYNIIRESPSVNDISSLQDAQQILDTTTPYDDPRELISYNQVIESTHDDIRTRLEELVDDPEHSVTDDTIQAIDVCYYGLRFRDLDQGKEYVLGSTGDNTDSSSQNKGLLTGWKYSYELSSNEEYYISDDQSVMIRVEPADGESNMGFHVSLSKDGSEQATESFSRYGDAKRQVKRWVLENSEP